MLCLIQMLEMHCIICHNLGYQNQRMLKQRLLQSILATITVLLQSKWTPHKACLKIRGAEILQDLGRYCRSATEEEDASVDNHFRNDRAAVIEIQRHVQGEGGGYSY